MLDVSIHETLAIDVFTNWMAEIPSDGPLQERAWLDEIPPDELR